MSPLPAAPHDELHDEKADLDDPGPLGDYLRFCASHFLEPYERADQEALSNQRLHRRFTRMAGVLGAIGLCIAACNIAFPGVASAALLRRPSTEYDWRLLFELVGAMLAALSVAAGLIFGWHKKWLLNRTKAEQLRLLKFRELVNPDFWCSDVRPQETQTRIKNEILLIDGWTEDHLPDIAEKEHVPTLPREAACKQLSHAQRLEILAYYRRKRLEFQIEYFSRSGKREHLSQRGGWLPLVFFASVVFAAGHVAFEHAGELELEKRIALAASLGIPAAWAAFRTYRTANEFGRNRSRSIAKCSALVAVENRLRPDASAGDVFADMGLCEYVLASDQGEWLRLMIEAEWYG